MVYNRAPGRTEGPSMLTVPTREESTQKYIRNSIRAYFEKEPGCDLDWIVGVLGTAKITARTILSAGFSEYARTERYRILTRRL
jgi:hypothetical protein